MRQHRRGRHAALARGKQRFAGADRLLELRPARIRAIVTLVVVAAVCGARANDGPGAAARPDLPTYSANNLIL